MKKFAFAALIAATIATPAAAETFSGPFIGAEIGYDNYELRGQNVLGTGYSLNGLSGNGVVGGLFAGYDLPLGNLFVGAEAFVNLSDAKISLTDGVDTISVRAKESYGVTARAGTMLNDSTGIYARAGWINTRFKGAINNVSDSDGQSGFQYGGGIETRVNTNASLRLEYIASDYGSADLGNGIHVGNGQVRFGAAFRF